MGRSVCTQEAIDRWLAKIEDPVRSRLMRFRAAMEDDGFRSSTIRAWLSQARVFLLYLAVRKKEPENVQPSDVRAFIRARLMRYRERRGRVPADLVEWRCGYTGAIHRLLREIQGQWPPTTAWTLRLEDYKTYLIGRRLDERYVRELCFHARQFLEYIAQHGLAPETVQPSQVTAYFSFASRRNRKKNWYWMEVHQRSVHHVLRYVQGEWPPGSTPSPLLSQFKTHLGQLRFSSGVIPSHVSAVRQFLNHLREQDTEPEKAQLHDLYSFIEVKQRKYLQKHGHAPNNINGWRIRYTAPIRRFMRMIDPHWPPPKKPANENERFQLEVCGKYIRWMTEVRGLAKTTVVKNGDEARQRLGAHSRSGDAA